MKYKAIVAKQDKGIYVFAVSDNKSVTDGIPLSSNERYDSMSPSQLSASVIEFTKSGETITLEEAMGGREETLSELSYRIKDILMITLENDMKVLEIMQSNQAMNFLSQVFNDETIWKDELPIDSENENGSTDIINSSSGPMTQEEFIRWLLVARKTTEYQSFRRGWDNSDEYWIINQPPFRDGTEDSIMIKNNQVFLTAYIEKIFTFEEFIAAYTKDNL